MAGRIFFCMYMNGIMSKPKLICSSFLALGVAVTRHYGEMQWAGVVGRACLVHKAVETIVDIWLYHIPWLTSCRIQQKINDVC